jgi:hypothetical protein
MRVLATSLAALACAAVASAAPQFSSQKQVPAQPGQKAANTAFGAVAPPSGTIMLVNADDCANPALISGTGTFAFDLTAATTGTEGQADPLCLFFGSTQIHRDVWFDWTAPATGLATVTTCNLTTVDTKLAAYAGAGCPAGPAIACNDDASGCGLRSRITFQVVGGTTYSIQLGTFPNASAGTGSMAITVDGPVTGGDQCTAPGVISGQGNFPFDNATATTGTQGQAEGLCLFFGSTQIHRDVWFTWTANASGTATVSTCTLTSVDTKIAAYAGAGCPAGAAIACNDDSCGLQSSLGFTVSNGSTYTIQLGSFPGSGGGTGSFAISIAAVLDNDDCSAPDAIAGQGSFPFNTTAATTGTQGQAECGTIGKDRWYLWTADVTGLATVDTCGTASFDTKLAAYPAAGCPANGTSLACNDDTSGCAGFTSRITFQVVAGTSYLIQIGGFGTASGTGTLNFSIDPPIVAYCFGDGTGTACPCANTGGPGQGCANSTGNGSQLTWSGSASVSANDLVLHATNDVTGQFGLFFQGVGAVNSGLGVLFGDGLRCANSTITRLQTINAPGGVGGSTSVSISAAGNVLPGQTRHYQFWYRTPQGPCGTGFNTSNGVRVSWSN